MKRVFLIAFWILTVTLVCSAQTTFYYPHIADGVLGGTVWKTTILLTNPAATGTASGTITFTRESADTASAGTVFSTIAFVDQDGAPAGSGGIITFSIPPGQTRKFTSSGAGAYGGGFATVTTTTGSVTGTAIFSEFDTAGRLIGEAGVPSANGAPNQAIFVDTQGGFNIGVAVANPGTAAANVTLSLLNSSAASVATTTRILGPGNHSAAFTSQIFQGAPAVAGTMQIRTNPAAPLAAIALRFDPTFNVFTTLPPVTLASLVTPAVKWFEQRLWFAPLTSVARLLGALQVRFG
jgi:hypothetical protein